MSERLDDSGSNDKAGDGLVYLCRASGEGTHDFRVCADRAGVFAFYEEMTGRDQDGTLTSLASSFDEPDDWSNDGTALEIELYCATFQVWKVDEKQLLPTARSADGECMELARQLDHVAFNIMDRSQSVLGATEARIVTRAARMLEGTSRSATGALWTVERVRVWLEETAQHHMAAHLSPPQYGLMHALSGTQPKCHACQRWASEYGIYAAVLICGQCVRSAVAKDRTIDFVPDRSVAP